MKPETKLPWFLPGMRRVRCRCFKLLKNAMDAAEHRKGTFWYILPIFDVAGSSRPGRSQALMLPRNSADLLLLQC